MKLKLLDVVSLCFLGGILLFNISILKDVIDWTTYHTCIFCSIVNYVKLEPILYESDLVMVLSVPNPRCNLHLLVIPRKHIKHIHSEEISSSLLQSMKNACLAVTESSSVHMMFHNPPFYSVPHLHMHCMLCNSNDDSPLLWNYWVNIFNDISGIGIEEAITRLEY